VDTSEIFVDNAEFFNYEEDNYGVVINHLVDLLLRVTIQFLQHLLQLFLLLEHICILQSQMQVLDTQHLLVDVKISAPSSIGVGIGTTASADRYCFWWYVFR
jgi:hypothetical protein